MRSSFSRMWLEWWKSRRPREGPRPTGAEPLWRPSAARVEAANLSAFRAYLMGLGHHIGPSYQDLWQWSVDDQAGFWTAAWDYFGVVGDRGSRALDGLESMPGCRYFPDARLNFAENLLRRRDDGIAVIAWAEDGRRRELTWGELYDQVARLADALRKAGVVAGDRVVAFVPNIPEALIYCLAAASIGATVATASPDFGVRGVLDRFGQLGPKVLLTADGYRYAGKAHSSLAKLPDIAAGMPSLELVILVPYSDPEPVSPDPLHSARVVLWEDCLAAETSGNIPFERLPFDHPLYVLFSSGTTGVPKCIVHGAGGVLLQHLKEHQLHCDIKPGDRVFYFSTLGWMMWNWLVTCLASDATILLYDGSPFHPDGNVLFDFAEATGMTHFGTSAKFLDAARKAGLSPKRTHQLPELRSVLSTGSPLSEEGFEYVYEHVGRDVHLASVSGGTDICASFVGGVPTEPVWKGEIQAPALATAVDVYAADGTSVSGGKGELVCTAPIPSMPARFFDDADGHKYRSAYFERFPGVWHHGDYIERTEHGGYVIYGRSDATLNVGGVRIGTAEVYRPVEAMEEVVEALVIGQEWEGDTRSVLFVRLGEGLDLDQDLRERIRRVIREAASPRHVPARIVQVTDIPRTKSGKIVELAVREAVSGRPVHNLEALANPEALDQFMGRSELRD